MPSTKWSGVGRRGSAYRIVRPAGIQVRLRHVTIHQPLIFCRALVLAIVVAGIAGACFGDPDREITVINQSSRDVVVRVSDPGRPPLLSLASSTGVGDAIVRHDLPPAAAITVMDAANCRVLGTGQELGSSLTFVVVAADGSVNLQAEPINVQT